MHSSHTTLLAALDDLMRLPPGTLSGPEELGQLKGWDSFAMVEYIALMNDMFALDISPEQVRKYKRVQDLLDPAP